MRSVPLLFNLLKMFVFYAGHLPGTLQTPGVARVGLAEKAVSSVSCAVTAASSTSADCRVLVREHKAFAA
jgi:hypothetical protein